MFKPKFNVAKCKTACGLVVGRLKLLKNKKATQARQMKREIAELLKAGRNDNAVIRTEAVILQEKMINALEVLELFCELLHVRLQLIDKTKDIPSDMREAISSLIFAAPRIPEVPEIKQLSQQLAIKYGKEFAATAAADDPVCRQSGVNEKLIEYLSVLPPPGRLKLDLLKMVADEFEVVEWDYELARRQLLASEGGEPVGTMIGPPPSQYTDYTSGGNATAAAPSLGAASSGGGGPVGAFVGSSSQASMPASQPSTEAVQMSPFIMQATPPAAHPATEYHDAASAARAAEQFSAQASEAAAAAARYAQAEGISSPVAAPDAPTASWPPMPPAGAMPPPPPAPEATAPPPGYPGVKTKTDEEIQREYDAATGPPEKKNATVPGPPSAPPAPGSGEMPQLPTAPQTQPEAPPDLPPIPPQGPQSTGHASVNELDELTKRFEALKRGK